MINNRVLSCVAVVSGLMCLGSVALAETGVTKSLPDQSPPASVSVGQDQVPVIIKYRDGYSRAMSGTSSKGSGSNIEFRSIPESDLDVELQKLRMSDEVEYAEPNYRVSSPKPVRVPIPSDEMPQPMSQGLAPGESPNDPQFYNQHTWKESTNDRKGQNSGLKAVQSAKENYRVTVGVVDSQFRNTDELRYAGGYNFSRADGNRIGANYLADYYDPTCTGSHGTAVANIIGAPTNNGRGMAGFVDADVWVARSMSCGSGFLFDTAESIRWLAGDPSLASAPPIGVNIDIINASLGAKAPCPTYLQDAINYAYAKGITVIVAAGNETMDAGDYTPANCKNVVTVASTDRYGKQSSFTNYGDSIDLAALGEMVLSMTGPGQTSFYYGTSFASPNVAGIAALVKQTNPFFGPDEIAAYLKSSAQKNPADPTAQIGAGIVKPVPVVTMAANLYENEKPSLTHVLDDPARCGQEVYQALLPVTVKACALYEVNASDLDAGAYRYTVFEMDAGATLSASQATPIKVSAEPVFLVSGLKGTGKDYGLGLCDANGSNCVSDALFPLGNQDIVSDRYCD